MKKRLLSAALALAMVLTLLPVSAFAATPVYVTYHAEQWTAPDKTTKGPGWYNTASPYDEVTTGVATSFSNGTYYGDIGAALTAKARNIILIDTQTCGSILASTTIDLNGQTLLGNGSIDSLTSAIGISDSSGAYALTVTSSKAGGTLAANIVSNTKSGASVSLTDVALTGSIDMTYNSGATVSLTDATVAGYIKLSGVAMTNAPTSSNGSITVSGSKATVAQGITLTHTDGSNGWVSITNGATVDAIAVSQKSGSGSGRNSGTVYVGGGATTSGITVTQDSGAVVRVDGEGSKTGAITVTQANAGIASSGTGGAVYVGTNSNNVTVDGKITVTSPGGGRIEARSATVTGGLELSGYGTWLGTYGSNVGAVLVNGSSAAADVDKDAPTIIISGRKMNGVSATNVKLDPNAQPKIASITIENDANVSTIDTSIAYANVRIDGATVTGNVNLARGVLTLDSVDQDRVEVGGQIKLGSANSGKAAIATDGSVTLDVKGSNVKVGGNITENTGNQKTLEVIIPSEPNNSFENIACDSNNNFVNFKQHTVSGGEFTGAVNEDLLNQNLKYVVYKNGQTAKNNNGKVAYYMANQINALVDLYQQATTKPKVVLKGTTASDGDGDKWMALWASEEDYKAYAVGGTSPNMFNAALVVYFDGTGSFQLPTMVGGKGSPWWSVFTPVANPRPSIEGGKAYGPNTNTDVVAALTGYTAKSITSVQVNTAGPNPTVSADLSGKVIKLSGPVTTVKNGSATIELKLRTDAFDLGDTGYPGIVTATVTYDPYNTAAGYTVKLGADAPTGMGVTAQQGIQVADGVTYTIDISGLSLSLRNSSLKVWGDGSNSKETTFVVADTTKVTRYIETVRKQLAEAMEATGGVDFSQSPAVLQQLGVVEKTITDANITKWLEEGQIEWWKNTHPGQTYNASKNKSDLTGSPYKQVALVLYMQLDVADYNAANGSDSGTMILNMTPYYRIEVWKTNTRGTADPIVVPSKKGAALGNLTGEFGYVTITSLPKDSKFTVTANKTQIHQDETYVYTAVAAVAPASTPTFKITHAGTGGKGLGKLVVNTTEPTVVLTRKSPVAEAGNYGYDKLQAAVDDTIRHKTNAEADIITVKDAYQGDGKFNVTGEARYFQIKANGSKTLSTASDDVKLTPNSDNTLYEVQLLKDNVAKPEEPTGIPISVSGATGGTASVSKSRANEGDVITITLSPSSGYQSSGVTVRSTDGTTTTTISVSGSGNRFTFTVPKGSKGVTVTPAFVRVNTGVLITVSGGTYGTATTSAGSNRVAVGSTVSVTVEPRSGYRTMGLYVTADTGSTATPYRTGVNTFTFTVPNATSSVVVTPRFDVNNGTIFEDVWSTDYYSSPVSWAVRQGVTDGTDTYHFSPGQSCNRVQMVTFLWRAAGRPSTAGMANPFYDVSPSMGNDFYNAILWANAKGITNGDGSTTRFNPYKTVTRAEAVTFLWRYEGQPAASTNSGFYDVPAREWYAPAVTWAVGRGITNGDGSTTRFNPNGACLRAQIVTFLYRDITGARA